METNMYNIDSDGPACYLFSRVVKPWAEAFDECDAHDMELVRVSTALEQAYLRTSLISYGKG